MGSIPTRSRQICACFALLASLAAPSGARGQDGEGDDTEWGPVEADSAVVVPPFVADSAAVAAPRAARGVRALPGGPAVWWVTVRSGLLPGWGQMVNRKPLKALLFAGVYTGFATSAVLAESDRRNAQDRIGEGDPASPDPALVAEVNDAVNRRNFGIWMMGATMVFSMLDAYVDAHFYRYDEQWRAGPVFEDGRAALAVGYRF